MVGRLIRWALVSLVIGGSVMALAGEWNSAYLWGMAASVAMLGLWATFRILDPELAKERFHPPSAGADAVALRAIQLSALATLIFAPLDSGRLNWSPPAPAALRVIGLCGFFGASWFTLLAMSTNPFFSSVIRIQSDRGHRVVDKGPYAVIRHPGYLGMIVLCPMAALGLGSLWALLPACLYSALILRRVVTEDRFLHQHLPGYGQYAARVRFRVLPYVW